MSRRMRVTEREGGIWALVLVGWYRVERTDCTAEAMAVEGLLLLKNTLEPEWLRSWILRRSLGVGKVGFG